MPEHKSEGSLQFQNGVKPLSTSNHRLLEIHSIVLKLVNVSAVQHHPRADIHCTVSTRARALTIRIITFFPRFDLRLRPPLSRSPAQRSGLRRNSPLHLSLGPRVSFYRVTHLIGRNLQLICTWDVPPSCLFSS